MIFHLRDRRSIGKVVEFGKANNIVEILSDRTLVLWKKNNVQKGFFLYRCFNFGLPHRTMWSHELPPSILDFLLDLSYKRDVWRSVPKFWDNLMDLMDLPQYFQKGWYLPKNHTKLKSDAYTYSFHIHNHNLFRISN